MPTHPRKRPRVFVDTDPDPEVSYWSPGPILEFRIRAWNTQSVRGPSRVEWKSHRTTAECLYPHVPGADDGTPPPHLPGQGGACLGGCGIYAFKDADKLIYGTLETPWMKRFAEGLPPHGDEIPEGLYGVGSPGG